MIERSRQVRVAALFLRLLGAVFVCAFASLASQVSVLVGRDGLLPAETFLSGAARVLGSFERLHQVPSVFWLGRGDGALEALAWAGALGGLAMTAGLAPRWLRTALWALYLSFVAIGQQFFTFQWDTLLLETSFLAIFLPARGREPSRWIAFLIRWLLFRLLFESGVSKLAFGDPMWRDGTAMSLYFETAPLPTWLGWWAHQAPPGVMAFFTWFTLFSELVVPFAIFAPRRVRLASLAVLVPFQLSILLTANYGFFNPLSLALYVFLLDDRDLAWIASRVRRVLRRAPAAASATAPAGDRVPPDAWRARVARAGFPALAAFVVVVSVADFWRVLDRRDPPEVVSAIVGAFAPFRTINSFHLFATMTRERDEVVIEGTADGVTWVPYEMRWKPADPLRAPAFVAPHQPRVDFQMWFLPLARRAGSNPWFDTLVVRLCTHPELARALFTRDPFDGRPPKALRVAVDRYHFTDLATRRATGAWWRRDRLVVHPRVYTCGDEKPPRYF